MFVVIIVKQPLTKNVRFVAMYVVITYDNLIILAKSLVKTVTYIYYNQQMITALKILILQQLAKFPMHSQSYSAYSRQQQML